MDVTKLTFDDMADMYKLRRAEILEIENEIRRRKPDIFYFSHDGRRIAVDYGDTWGTEFLVDNKWITDTSRCDFFILKDSLYIEYKKLKVALGNLAKKLKERR
jgi:hypothetical protein